MNTRSKASEAAIALHLLYQSKLNAHLRTRRADSRFRPCTIIQSTVATPQVKKFPFHFMSHPQRASCIVDRLATPNSFPRAQGVNALLHCLVKGTMRRIPWDADRSCKTPLWGQTRRGFHKGVLMRFGDREREAIPGTRQKLTGCGPLLTAADLEVVVALISDTKTKGSVY